MTQTKTHSEVFKEMAAWLHRPFLHAWQRCVLVGTREIEELRGRSGPCCPQCGGVLMRRKVSFGRDAGKEYWDCSNVLKCFVSLEASAVVCAPSFARPFANG